MFEQSNIFMKMDPFIVHIILFITHIILQCFNVLTLYLIKVKFLYTKPHVALIAVQDGFSEPKHVALLFCFIVLNILLKTA